MTPLALALLVALIGADRKDPQPPVGTATERARLLVRAIRENKSDVATPFFYPRAEFPKVKAIKDPDGYFRQLMKVYLGDVAIMRKGLSRPDTIEFVEFKLSGARRWVEKFKEANKRPYWAAYKSMIVVRDNGKRKTLPVRVMISWEGQWYVTHLTRK